MQNRFFLNICKFLFQNNFLNIIEDEMVEILLLLYTEMDTSIIITLSYV